MKIIITGAGEVGAHLSELLSAKGHEVTVIESNEQKADLLDETLNAKVIKGNGSSAGMLKRAGVDRCDFFLGLTSDDRTNLIACSLAKVLSSKVKTVARIHDQTYSDNSIINYQLHFGIDYLLNPEALCALELAKAMRNPSRLAVENIARGQVEVQQVTVSKSSKVAGKTLRDIRLESGVRIGFIRKGPDVSLPTADTVLETGDVVALFGKPEDLLDVRTQFDPGCRLDTVRVVLFGASEIAISLLRVLNNPRFKIRIIEKSENLCRVMAERFEHVTIIQGDATSLRVLEEEQIDSADYFVACTKDDEDNIMTSLQASRLGAKHVQLVINRADYQEVISTVKTTLGVELIVSPRLATANEILRAISTEMILELASLERAGAKIVEIKVAPDSAIAGKMLREISLPEGTVIIALLHKYAAKVPGPDDSIIGGDRVVAIVRTENLSALKDAVE
ncbi:MAG: Trk system potassium transporter TrkA [Verrucomicrobiota bacterium]